MIIYYGLQLYDSSATTFGFRTIWEKQLQITLTVCQQKKKNSATYFSRVNLIDGAMGFKFNRLFFFKWRFSGFKTMMSLGLILKHFWSISWPDLSLRTTEDIPLAVLCFFLCPFQSRKPPWSRLTCWVEPIGMCLIGNLNQN